MRPVRGGDHVAVLEGAADADGTGFLADRDVEEPWQLARAEALLDLLLETSDQEHLPEHIRQIALRERRLGFDLCHRAQFMVQVMTLVDQWNIIERGLDPRWSDAQVMLSVENSAHTARAATLLAPAGPVKTGAALRFYVSHSGAGVGPEAVRRMLGRIAAEGISGALELVGSSESSPAPAAVEPTSLAAGWDAAVAVLPADWSDLLCELSLTSSDYLDVTALHIGPLNPLRGPAGMTFRFRVAQTFGYGASPGMVRRCLQRVDAAGIPGSVRVLRLMSDSHPVGIQGPVWYVGGKAV